jgi:hypothetical protein
MLISYHNPLQPPYFLLLGIVWALKQASIYFLFIYGLFNNAASNVDCIASIGMMITVEWIGKNAKGNGVVWILFRHLSTENEEDHEELVPWPGSLMRGRNATHSTA